MESIAIKETKERILSLDVIRGFSILGILLMNIQSFSMVGQAYLNPTAYGDLLGLNKWAWIISHVFADQKFMSIFSMLFGASIIMITQGIEQKKRSSLKTHYSRNFWLLIIGLIHAYLIWYGDILTPYAICAFLLYPFRKVSVNKLLIIGVLVFSISSIGHIRTGIAVAKWPKEAVQSLSSSWSPSQKQIDREVNAYLSDFGNQLIQRAKTAKMMHTTLFLTHYLWHISGLMLIGMALFKSGFLTGDLSSQFYKRILISAGLLGISMVIIGVFKNFEANWSIEYSMFLGSQFNYWGSLGMALAYISGIILICKNRWCESFTSRLAAIGRMALSNYLFQSLICTSIFYGFGLGMFGQIERAYQLIIIMVIWMIQLLLSPIWFKYFKYGPVERLWRILTDFKTQSIIK